MSKNHVAALLASLASVFTLSACGNATASSSSASPSSSSASASAPTMSGKSVADQCERFIDVSTAGLKKIEDVDSPDPAKDATTSAKLFDALAADVAKIGITDPELKKLSDQYVTMIKDAATTQRALGKLLGKADPATPKAEKDLEKELGVLEKQVDKYVKTEDTLVDKMNDYCKDK